MYGNTSLIVTDGARDTAVTGRRWVGEHVTL